MNPYHKIHTIYKRDLQTKKLIPGDYSREEFAFLSNNQWVWDEKVDGTNIRVMWDEDYLVSFGGRTDAAQIPVTLYRRLGGLFPSTKFEEIWGDQRCAVCLYGEGYGAKIQKGGGNYKADDVDFVLFDVNINGVWLEREQVEDIADKMGIDTTPIIGTGTLDEATEFVREGFQSRWGRFDAEGIVLRPQVRLLDKRGSRIIAKLKHKDFQ